MRSALAFVSTLLILASACSDYDGATAPPYDRPPAPMPVEPPGPQPDAPAYIRSIAILAPDSVLVAGTAERIWVVGLDSSGRLVDTLSNARFKSSNAFSIGVSSEGILTAFYSSFAPFRSDVTASAVVHGDTLTSTKRFAVTSAAPARFDFLTALLPENVRPEPIVSAADGIVYLTLADSRIVFTLLWSHLTGRPIGAHIHGPVDGDRVAGVLADFPMGSEFDDHGVLRSTLTAESIRARDGRPPISLDSLVTLIRNRAVYVDIHSAENPSGEVRGTPFASGL